MSAWWLTWSPLVYLAVGWLAATAYWTVLTGGRTPKSIARRRERIRQLEQRRLNLAAGVVDVDEELAALWAEAPDHQAIGIATQAERVHWLTKQLRRAARIFGADVKDDPPALRTITGYDPTIETTHEGGHDAWGLDRSN